MASLSLFTSLLLSLTFFSFSSASPFTLEIHNRFSDRVRQWAESRGHPGTWWPQHGTAEYYASLAHHDRALHNRRSLETSSPEVIAFSGGNATQRMSSLGYLYYAYVELGTPNVTFFVALDTGSDLLWVPCDCKQCAALSSPSYGVDIAFNMYSPSNSNTSETISCGSSSCEQVQSTCSGSNGNCTYSISYVSANTSTSGYLVEDVMYFTTETTQTQTIQPSIIFGCGQSQTGTFLNGGAPDGLMGLSMSNLSVPSILANKGYTSNSFSMCFSEDGIGRINFGDAGSSDQSETPLNVDNTQADLYNISLTGFSVGNSSYQSSFSALVDSGTSFTYLADPMYTDIVTSFNSQVQETRSYKLSYASSFEYCYIVSSGQISINTPSIAFTAQGGGTFPVNDALLIIQSTTGVTLGYCLAVGKSSSINIIGENSLTGLRIVFDRERLVLGWQNFDCYSSTPGPALGPNAYDPQKTNQVSVLENASAHLSAMSSLVFFSVVALLFM